MAQRKSPKAKSLSFRAIPVQRGHRSVRVAVYPPNDEQTTGVIFGIGYGSVDSFSKINFEVIPEEWAEVKKAVDDALKLAKKLPDVPGPATAQARRRAAQRAPREPQTAGVGETPVQPFPPFVGDPGVGEGDVEVRPLTATRRRKTPPPFPTPGGTGRPEGLDEGEELAEPQHETEG